MKKVPVRRTRAYRREKALELAATLRWFTAGGAIRIAHYDVIDDAITRKV